MGGILAVGAGSPNPPRMIVLEHNGFREQGCGFGKEEVRQSSQSALRNPHIGPCPSPGRRQIHHLRHRRHLHQARRKNGRHDLRQVRRHGRARPHVRRRQARSSRSTSSASSPAAENHVSGTAYRPGDILTHVQRRHRRGDQHRRRRPPRARRRDRLGHRNLQARRRRRPRDPHRRRASSPWAHDGRRHVPTTTRSSTSSSSAADAAGEKIWRLPVGDDQRDRSRATPPTSSTPPAAGPPPQGGAFLSHFVLPDEPKSPGPTSTSPASPTPTRSCR